MPCEQDPDLCNKQGACSNDNTGGYECSCNEGFTGTNCEIGKYDLKKILLRVYKAISL